MKKSWCALALVLMVSLGVFGLVGAVRADIDQPPINYSTATPANCISQLQTRLEKGLAKLDFDENQGYLKSVLNELKIPFSSQVLVFSKTSFQAKRIGPKTPRALYFNDDLYVGFCLNGDVLEFSAVDAKLGAVFYTLDQNPAAKPEFSRRTDSCLLCHASSAMHGFPGQLVRSVYPEPDGTPAFNLGSVLVNHTTPFDKRWGGWYVTGTSGKQQHRGNLILKNRFGPPPSDNLAGTNLTSLKDKLHIDSYLTPHSDLVALMVLEHQTEMHNRITRANFETRLALYQQAELDAILKRDTEGLTATTKSRIKSCCEPLVEYLLFSKEAELSEKVCGTSTFAVDFALRGPKDKKGRSLREFDLQQRLFKYPCSYLIYSETFAKLPREAKDYIYERLWDILHGHPGSSKFDHLTAQDCQAVREILIATLPDLPDYWKK
jgi:hypothetical protein